MIFKKIGLLILLAALGLMGGRVAIADATSMSGNEFFNGLPCGVGQCNVAFAGWTSPIQNNIKWRPKEDGGGWFVLVNRESDAGIDLGEENDVLIFSGFWSWVQCETCGGDTLDGVVTGGIVRWPQSPKDFVENSDGLDPDLNCGKGVAKFRLAIFNLRVNEVPVSPVPGQIDGCLDDENFEVSYPVKLPKVWGELQLF